MSNLQATPEQHSQPDRKFLNLLLRESAARHAHLCPRQVLGVRLGLHALMALGLIDSKYQPRYLNLDKRLLTIVETDGCGADGIAIATGCTVGRRTLRVLDFGKLAATLVDTQKDKAVRVAPSSAARQLAIHLLPEASDHWNAYLQAYQVIPDCDLMDLQEVRLTRSVADILSKPTSRATCASCGEEIMNERELVTDAGVLCRTCAGDSYYEPAN